MLLNDVLMGVVNLHRGIINYLSMYPTESFFGGIRVSVIAQEHAFKCVKIRCHLEVEMMIGTVPGDFMNTCCGIKSLKKGCCY